MSNFVAKFRQLSLVISKTFLKLICSNLFLKVLNILSNNHTSNLSQRNMVLQIACSYFNIYIFFVNKDYILKIYIILIIHMFTKYICTALECVKPRKHLGIYKREPILESFLWKKSKSIEIPIIWVMVNPQFRDIYQTIWVLPWNRLKY